MHRKAPALLGLRGHGGRTVLPSADREENHDPGLGPPLGQVEPAALHRLMGARMVKAGRRDCGQVLRPPENDGLGELQVAMTTVLHDDAITRRVLCRVERGPPKLTARSFFTCGAPMARASYRMSARHTAPSMAGFCAATWAALTLLLTNITGHAPSPDPRAVRSAAGSRGRARLGRPRMP